MMKVPFSRLCVRPQVGYVYDKDALVELPDGISFSELLCKVTSKCDTNLMLLSSHKGKMRDVAVNFLGLQTQQSQSMSAAVISSFKKGLSFLNGSKSNSSLDDSAISDDEQVLEAWEKCYSSGYHGMMVLSLIDKNTMPDNESRKLYDLHQFVTVIFQSINAYYMFQKPEVAFVYDEEFAVDSLRQAYPNADTFALTLMWRFAEDPTIAKGISRPVPIVRSTSHKEYETSRGIDTERNSASLGPKALRTSVYTPSRSFREATSTSNHEYSDASSTTAKPNSTTKTTITSTKRKVTEIRDKSYLSPRSPVAVSPLSPVDMLKSGLSQSEASCDNVENTETSSDDEGSNDLDPPEPPSRLTRRIPTDSKPVTQRIKGSPKR